MMDELQEFVQIVRVGQTLHNFQKSLAFHLGLLALGDVAIVGDNRIHAGFVQHIGDRGLVPTP